MAGDNAPNHLLCFDEVRKLPTAAVGSVCRGTRAVPVEEIGGSVGRCSEFDREHLRERLRKRDGHS
jgi:hypothetical protein